MPHIHGVAWIEQLCLNGLGFKNGFLCEGEQKDITKLAGELISQSNYRANFNVNNMDTKLRRRVLQVAKDKNRSPEEKIEKAAMQQQIRELGLQSTRYLQQ